jgi:hypothetical protein
VTAVVIDGTAVALASRARTADRVAALLARRANFTAG